MSWIRKFCCRWLRLVEREEMDEAYRVVELLTNFQHCQRKCKEAQDRLDRLKSRIEASLKEPWE